MHPLIIRRAPFYMRPLNYGRHKRNISKNRLLKTTFSLILVIYYICHHFLQVFPILDFFAMFFSTVIQNFALMFWRDGCKFRFVMHYSSRPGAYFLFHCANIFTLRRMYCFLWCAVDAAYRQQQ